MSSHPVPFQTLADWLDGQLDREAFRAIEAHLSAGCPHCEAELTWLRRVEGAARFDGWSEPPAEAVAQVKALLTRRAVRPLPKTQPAVRRSWTWMPRLAFAATAAALLLALVAAALTQMPDLLPRQARITAYHGAVETRQSAGGTWHAVSADEQVPEGASVRVLDGIAMITLPDKSALLLGAGSELTLATMRSSLLGVANRIAIEQYCGRVEYDVASLKHARSSFQARSPGALVTVHGTRFVLQVEADTPTQLAVIEGRVQVAVTAGSVQASGSLTSVVLNQDDTAIVPATDAPVFLPSATPPPQRTATSTASATALPRATASPLPAATPTHGLETPGATLPPMASPVPPGPTAAPVPSVDESPTPAVLRPTLPTPVPTATAVSPLAEFEPVAFDGVIESFPRGYIGEWIISGRMVWVTHSTEIHGTPRVGLKVQVTGRPLSPRAVVALTIDVIIPGNAATAIPSLTPESTSTPLAVRPTSTSPAPAPSITLLPVRPTLTATVVPTLTETPATQETEEPTATPQRTGVPPVTVIPGPRRTDTPTPTVELEPTPTPDPPAETLTPTPEPSATETTPPVPTPTPSATALPLETPVGPPLERWSGKIERLPQNLIGPWVIGGRIVHVTPQTQIQGRPAIGLLADVEAVDDADMILRARRIVVINASES